MNIRIGISGGLLIFILLCGITIYFYNDMKIEHYAHYNELTSDELLEHTKDGQYISLKGYLVKRLTEDTYLFRTDGHSIIVEIDDFDFPKQAFGQHSLLNIVGEVDRDFLEPVTVEVERIDVL